MGMTPYLPASTYQVAIISMSLSRCSAARLWFSAGSSVDVVQLPARGIELGTASRREMGSPKPMPASANEGPGQGHTARQPSW